MKKTIQLIAAMGGFLLLTGCSTVNTSPQAIQQNLSADDQQQLNLKLNTIQDNQPEIWHSADGDTLYQLTTSDTHVNAQGVPCRTYNFLVDRKYHRKQATTALTCRIDGQWQASDN